MAQEALKHIRQENTSLRQIIFCAYNDEDYSVFNKGVSGYLDYVVNNLGQGPYITVDAIIEIDDSIVIIQRSNPPFGWALPGGFVDYGESLEDAVIREAKEETNMEITQLKQFRTYSDPDRDPRFHTIGTVFIAKAKGNPRAGDDAKGLKVIPLKDIKKFDFAFDHGRIIEDYIKARRAK
ncbi:MAG: NUDIX domain-containing protein [Candidatus Omnitrophota bacterium]|nr:MAG: NUDIX domain-containing protein [Candidatus Omnitrophota bacterium]